MSGAYNILVEVAREVGLTPAQTRAFLATSRVESGWDPGAVGDGGTSFGLFQHHIGGAGGSTEEEARRYLDPYTSARERARWFKRNNIVSGAGAAALQRPADPSGYARKVDAAMRGVNVDLNAPVAPGSPAQQAGSPAQPREGLSDIMRRFSKKRVGLLSDDEETSDIDRLAQRKWDLLDTLKSMSGSSSASSAAPAPSRPGSFGWTKGKEEGSYRDLMRWGEAMGGNPGSTTGGRHTPGSYHYQSRAVDFGDATNSPEAIANMSAYAQAHPDEFTEFFYDPNGWYIKNGKVIQGSIGGHGDHIHAARRGDKGRRVGLT